MSNTVAVVVTLIGGGAVIFIGWLWTGLNLTRARAESAEAKVAELRAQLKKGA